MAQLLLLLQVGEVVTSAVPQWLQMMHTLLHQWPLCMHTAAGGSSSAAPQLRHWTLLYSKSAVVAGGEEEGEGLRALLGEYGKEQVAGRQ